MERRLAAVVCLEWAGSAGSGLLWSSVWGSLWSSVWSNEGGFEMDVEMYGWGMMVEER